MKNQFTMEYFKMIEEINQKLMPLLLSKSKNENDKQLIKELLESKKRVEQEFMDNSRPCNPGDSFTAITWGGRRVKGIAIDFKVFKGEVYIDSYFPVVKGVKSSKPAFFSMPYQIIEY